MSPSSAPVAASPFGPRWATALAAGACVLWRTASLGVLDNDHFVHLARAHQILHGAWPLRDFSDPGLPGQYLLSALAAEIFGATPLTDAALCVAMLALAAAVTLRLAHRATGSLVVAIAITLAQVLAMPRLYGAPKVLVYVVAVAGVWRYLDAPTWRRAAALGAWTAAAFLLRHDHGVYLGTAVAMAVVVGGLERGQRRLGDLLVMAAACALVLLPWAVYVQTQMGLPAYVESALAFSRAEAIRTARRWPSHVLASPERLFTVMALYAGMVMPVVVLLTTRWRHVALTRAQVLVVALLLAFCDLGFLRDQMTDRLPDIAGPLSIAVAVLLGVDAVRRRITSPRVVAGAFAAILLALAAWKAPRLTSGIAVPTELTRRALAAVDGSVGWPWSRTMPTPALLPLVRYVEACTGPADAVLVGWFAPEFSVYARRPFGGGHPSWLPGYFTTDAEQAQIRRWLLARPPRVVLLDGSFERTWPWAWRALTALGRYRLVRTIRIGQAEVTVWILDVPVSATPDLELGLPCVEPQHAGVTG